MLPDDIENMSKYRSHQSIEHGKRILDVFLTFDHSAVLSPCVLVCPRPLHLQSTGIAGHLERSAVRLCRGTYDGWLCLRTLAACGHYPSLHGPHSLFAIQRSLVKVAKQEPTRLSLSGGANMYVAVHLFIRFYFSFDEYSGSRPARANGRIFLGGPRWGGGPRWALSLPIHDPL